MGDSQLMADTLQYDDSNGDIPGFFKGCTQPADNAGIKKQRCVASDLLSEEETCALTSWVLQGLVLLFKFHSLCQSLAMFPHKFHL